MMITTTTTNGDKDEQTDEANLARHLQLLRFLFSELQGGHDDDGRDMKVK